MSFNRGPLRGRVIIDSKTIENLAMDTYRTQIATWLSGGSASPPRHIAIGDGTLDPSVGDLALSNETFRKQVSSRFKRGSDVARLTATFNVDEPPVPPGSSSIIIRELGLFDAGNQAISNDGFETWTGGSPDSWASTSSGSMSQESGTANIYEQGYSLRFARLSGTPSFYQDLTWSSILQSQQCTLRAVVKAGSANLARIFIDDSISITNSSFHSGGGGLEVLSVQKTLGTAATRLRIGGELNWGGTAGTIGSAFFDWMRCIQNGNLWARTLFSLDKEADEPLSVAWELYFERQDEEGTMPFTAYDQEEISQGTAIAGSLTPARYNPTGAGVAQQALVSIEDNNIRFWYGGGTPSLSSGHILNSDDIWPVEGNDNIAQFRMIAIGGTAKVKVSYLR